MDNSKPINVVIVATYLFLFGLPAVGIGFVSITIVPLVMDTGKELAFSYLLFFFGIADLVAAYGLWRRQEWARRFTLLDLLLSIAVTPIFITETSSPSEIDAMVVGCFLNAVMILLIWNKRVGDWLRNKPRITEQAD